jgi:hypothetical protein
MAELFEQEIEPEIAERIMKIWDFCI